MSISEVPDWDDPHELLRSLEAVVQGTRFHTEYSRGGSLTSNKMTVIHFFDDVNMFMIITPAGQSWLEISAIEVRNLIRDPPKPFTRASIHERILKRRAALEVVSPG